MPLIPPFINELGQYACLPTTVKTLQDYQNVVSYFIHYAREKQDSLEAKIFGCGEESSHPLKFNFIEVESNSPSVSLETVESNSRSVSLELFLLAQQQQNNLPKFPKCSLRIEISLSYFSYQDYFFKELFLLNSSDGTEWWSGDWSIDHYSLLPHISLHQISEEQLIYDWVKEYMKTVHEDNPDQIAECFNEIDEIMIPPRYLSLWNFYQTVFDFDRSNFNDSSVPGELRVSIYIQTWQEYQERYPLLKTIFLIGYRWLNDEEPEDDMMDEEEEEESEGEYQNEREYQMNLLG